MADHDNRRPAEGSRAAVDGERYAEPTLDAAIARPPLSAGAAD